MKRHSPLPYYTDMGDSALEMQNHVPLDQWTQDVANGSLPNFAFITPNSLHDMHDCPDGLSSCLQEADRWLQTNIDPLLARPEFQAGGDGLLVLWADEADLYGDNRCSAAQPSGCGGHVMVALIGPNVKPGLRSTTTYHHPSVLKLMLQSLGIRDSFPGAANGAPDMTEFFDGHSGTGCALPSVPGVMICSPANSSTAFSPIHFVALATPASGQTISAMFVYVDDVLVYQGYDPSLDILVPVDAGSHNVRTQVWDSSGALYKAGVDVAVTQ